MSNNENSKNIFGTVLCGLIVLFLATVIPYRIISAEGLIPPTQVNTIRFLGAVLILLGIIGYILCFRNFVVDAQGTPLPGGIQQHLIVNGLYRYVRNPIYISWYQILLGEAVFFQSTNMLYYLAIWMILFHFKVVMFEEPYLRATFGETYEQYCRSVHRWIPMVKISKTLQHTHAK